MAEEKDLIDLLEDIATQLAMLVVKLDQLIAVIGQVFAELPEIPPKEGEEGET